MSKSLETKPTTPSQDTGISLKDKVEIGQGILTILRDLIVASAIAFLFIDPVAFGGMMSKVGINGIGPDGIDWEAKFKETDAQFKETNAQFKATDATLLAESQVIAKLENNLERSNETIVSQANLIEQLKTSTALPSAQIKEELNSGESQIKENEEAISEANSVSVQTQDLLEENTPLVSTQIEEGQEIDSFVQIVNDYSIQILYNEKNPDQDDIAKDIKQKLEDLGIKTEISIAPHQDSASSNQIRYFKANERDVAYALQVVLDEVEPNTKFNLQTVYTPTPGSVSIFLKS